VAIFNYEILPIERVIAKISDVQRQHLFHLLPSFRTKDGFGPTAQKDPKCENEWTAVVLGLCLFVRTFARRWEAKKEMKSGN
jgi:hypothetical protein